MAWHGVANEILKKTSRIQDKAQTKTKKREPTRTKEN